MDVMLFVDLIGWRRPRLVGPFFTPLCTLFVSLSVLPNDQTNRMNMLLALLVVSTFLAKSQASTGSNQQRNIILIITDDQDVELGSMQFMPKTLKLIKEKGVEFTSGYVTTPICCPSRSSILTGLYVHNHNIHTNNQNCSGPEWRRYFEKKTFGVYLQNAGYRTAYMGKYLNEYDGSYIPPGWNEWLAIVKNSKFYNYTVNENGQKDKYGFLYEKDYFTDLVTNKSLDFVRDHFESKPWQPFALVVSYPAPHGPEDPAPQHSHLFENVFTHRTDSWNHAPNPDKQWLLQRTGKMSPVHIAFTDMLHRRRLQTLQSVDEGVYRIFGLLREMNQLSNTYVMYTSDHGYHLGQFGLLKGKNMPYEFDVRVPYYLRGPGVPRNETCEEIVTNLDIGPTLLDIAGLRVPRKMNGRSILELLKIKKGGRKAKMIAPWRDTILIERGKMPKLKNIADRWKKQKSKFNKELRLSRECRKRKWQRDCVDGQLWKCYKTDDEKWRIYKCRENWNLNCPCERSFERMKRELDDEDEFLMNAAEEELQEDSFWSQGGWQESDETFEYNDHQVKKRHIESKCDCLKNSTHPIKYRFLKRGRKLDFMKIPKKNIGNSRKNCSLPQMNCFIHSPFHWRTPPLWPVEFGEFCFCQNCNNNTYWCLRTKNATDNFLYCEFVTGFISYYDMNVDPHQMYNIVYTLDVVVLENLSEQLRRLRKCKSDNCDKLGLPSWRSFKTSPSRTRKKS
ncbi:unnamed protein product [Caenorhabditis auriculariae]|uniref:Sulfatase N-terminal domain-containing protein n=1 Tax=Caenorhabditis auriculariae TaxID=2777116 RepID=A0A8S1GUX0_9PELO|nr:unnamed protein product [Caenorhabditis auriculariae]